MSVCRNSAWATACVRRDVQRVTRNVCRVPCAVQRVTQANYKGVSMYRVEEAWVVGNAHPEGIVAVDDMVQMLGRYAL